MSEINFVTRQALASVATQSVCLGEGAPVPIYPDLGWEELQRPKRKGVLVWRGASLMRQEIPIELNGRGGRGSVQSLFDWLESTVRRTDSEPEPVRISGPVFHTELSWAVEAMDWSDVSRRDGVLIVAKGTIKLVEYEANDIVKRVKKGPRTYTVKKGDTLQSIAARQLGSSKRWKEILKLNRKKIKNSKKLKPGTVLVLPDR